MGDLSNYPAIRGSAETYYKQIGKIFCPAFQQTVCFSAEGFNHLVYKSDRTERDRSVQMMKFKLLSKVKKLIEITTTYQEFEECLQTFQVKRFKKRVHESKIVRYWGGNCHFGQCEIQSDT